MGQRIKLAREQRNRTQPELAKKLGFGSTWMSDIERGAAGIDALDLQALANELEYPLEFFLNPSYDPNPAKPRNIVEWNAVYPDDPLVAEAHLSIDRAMRRRELLNQDPEEREVQRNRLRQLSNLDPKGKEG